MSALFTWDAVQRAPSPIVGQRRIVTRFLFLPKKLGGQWRWLGFQRITQEFQRYRVSPPEMRSMDVVGWRAVAWDRSRERMVELRHLAAKLWHEDGGHMPYQNGGMVHEFMVQHPDTRKEYEKRAAAIMDAP